LHIYNRDGEKSTGADPTSSDPPGHITPTTPPGPTSIPPTPIVALLIVQHEEISCYYGYSDRRMHTIFIKLPEILAKRKRIKQKQSGGAKHPVRSL